MTYGHAVVVGASVSGLLAAGAAANAFESVTLVERDPLPEGPDFRRGTPQGNQLHALLPFGLAQMEAVLPGLKSDFENAGATPYDDSRDMATLLPPGWRKRVSCTHSQALGMRRPLLEFLLRQRLLALPNVTYVQGSVAGLLSADDSRRVTGVKLKDGTAVEADLVVAATGRNGAVTKWLDAIGVPAPAETEVRVYMGYSTQYVTVADDAFEGGVTGIVAPATPANLTGAVLLPADNGTWALTAVGMMKQFPPSKHDEFLHFLDQAPTPLIGEIARKSTPVSDIFPYAMQGNLRRHWEDLSALPNRLIVIGDAVASFNPVYGQGMSMAAVEAGKLAACLTEARGSLDTFCEKFQGSLRTSIDIAFSMSAGNDALYDGVELYGYPAPNDAETQVGAALGELCTVDTEIVRALAEAAFQMRPEVLSGEYVQQRVQEWLTSGSQPARFNPRDYPHDAID